MFENYIDDAYNLALEARQAGDEKVAKRYYRASIFYAVSAIEAFVNFIGETLEKGGKTPPYEVAFIIDKKFGIRGDKFEIMDQPDYGRLDEKLRYLIRKYASDYDLSTEDSWRQFMEFKKFRDSLVHPKKDEDDITIDEYDNSIRVGLSAIIEIMNGLCKGMFGRNLRKKIIELTL